MSSIDRILVTVLALGVAVVGVFSLVTYRRVLAWESKPRPAPVAPLGEATEQSLVSPADRRRSVSPADGPVAPAPGSQGTLAMADGLLASGRLREAQERYLDVLLSSGPENQSAMRGLIEVRRRLASDNAAVLREQGEAYRAAAEKGVETTEHYTPEVMRLLAKASFMAAVQVDGRETPKPQASERVPVPREATARPGPRPSPARPQSQASLVPPNPQPGKAQVGLRGRTDQEIPPPSQIPETGGPFYVALIGPFADREQAAESAAQLTIGGYGAQLTTRPSGEPRRRYVVVSEAISRRTAEARAETLGAGGMKATIREQTNGTVQLQFGNFSTPEEAEAVARRVRRQGYTAVILTEGGTAYFILVGPHRKAMVDALTARLARSVYTVTVTRAP